jgi:hypothetical protein
MGDIDHRDRAFLSTVTCMVKGLASTNGNGSLLNNRLQNILGVMV